MADKLPDFIIPGAMKSGTSSLHYVLSQSDEVFIPGSEINFFNKNDFRSSSVHELENIIRDDTEKLEKYRENFSEASESQIVGERSTGYMSSKRAPELISDSFNNDVKVIFMLRDPVSRSYSHYKHVVRVGREYTDFATALDRNKDLVQRGLYKQQIERYKQYFDEEQMMFVIFEEFVENQQQVINDVCDFLDIENIDVEGIDTHRNPSPGFRTLRGQLLANFVSEFTGAGITWFARLNRSTKLSFPEMDEKIETSLERLFRIENKGISDLIMRDVSKYWSWYE